MTQIKTITKDMVKDALREVYDPEIAGISVQDLGLIYEINITGDHVHVKHTLTSMMCPFAEEICSDIYEAVAGIDGVKTVNRELVFQPEFSVEMVPEDTRMIMGWY
jgi:metal-sulfur cluster biosynthetic enzyme